jgi:hypothetical protein
MASRRFRIAFSFAGEQRKLVGKVAAILAKEFGEEAILYDKYHEAEFSHGRLGMTLPDLYRNESDLIVVTFCPDYDDKLWTGWEWAAIHDLLNKRDGSRVMLTRFGRVKPTGLSDGSGFVELDGRTPDEFARLILRRLAINENAGSHSPGKSSKPSNIQSSIHSRRTRPASLLTRALAGAAVMILAGALVANWPKRGGPREGPTTRSSKSDVRPEDSGREFRTVESIRSHQSDALFNTYLDDPALDDKTRSAVQSLRTQYGLLTTRLEEASREGNQSAMVQAFKGRFLLLYSDPISKMVPAALVDGLKALGLAIERRGAAGTPLTWEILSAEDTLLECCDGIDNDDNTTTDIADANCAPFVEAVRELQEFVMANDGIDNDGDRLIDAADRDLDSGTDKRKEGPGSYSDDAEGTNKIPVGSGNAVEDSTEVR